LLILGCRQFLFVLLRFNRFELRTNIVVVDFELEYLLVTDRIGEAIVPVPILIEAKEIVAA
jgi:hypothetical protein